MELKKSYKLFVIWLICFLILMFGVCFIPGLDSVIMTRLVFNLCSWSIVSLCYMIYKTEYVYWFNGTTYEQAVKAGEERRKDFALKHLKRFYYFAIIYLLLSLIFHLYHVKFWVDIYLFTVGIIITAISTIKIKL